MPALLLTFGVATVQRENALEVMPMAAVASAVVENREMLHGRFARRA